MRITHEADYAIRIIYTLAEQNRKMSAKEIAETAGITERFALKILRKLNQCGMIASFKGVKGGYVLNIPAAEISVGQIIESIDGPIQITCCLDSDYLCTRMGGTGRCSFSAAFRQINRELKNSLNRLKIDTFLSGK